MFHTYLAHNIYLHLVALFTWWHDTITFVIKQLSLSPHSIYKNESINDAETFIGNLDVLIDNHFIYFHCCLGLNIPNFDVTIGSS